MGNWGYTYGFSLSTYNRTSTGYLIIQNLPCVRMSAVMIKWHKFKRKTSRKLITLNTMISLMCYLNEYWLIDFCILFPIWEITLVQGRTHCWWISVQCRLCFALCLVIALSCLLRPYFSCLYCNTRLPRQPWFVKKILSKEGFFAEKLHHINIHKRLIVHFFYCVLRLCHNALWEITHFDKKNLSAFNLGPS